MSQHLAWRRLAMTVMMAFQKCQLQLHYYYNAYFLIVPQWANIMFLPKYLFITLYDFIMAVSVIIVYMWNFLRFIHFSIKCLYKEK